MSSKSVNSSINIKIGAKLLRIRQRAGLSQQNVAFDLEFSPTTYSKLENGKIDFSAFRLVQLADYFKVYAPDLLDPDLEMPRLLTEVKTVSEYKIMETRYDLLREMFGNTNK